MPGFSGFSKATFGFLAGLEANNSKDWFEANRAAYDEDLIAPALDFVAALAPMVAQMNPSYQAVPKMNGSLRRLHRDLRFSKDKTPFSPRLHLVFWHGSHPNRAPAIHLVLHGDGLGLGVGQWAMAADELAAYRAALAAPARRAKLKAALKAAEGVGATLGDPELARLPKGVDSIGEDDHFLRRKGLVARSHTRLPIPAEMLGPGAVDYASTLIKAVAPVSDWLVETTT